MGYAPVYKQERNERDRKGERRPCEYCRGKLFSHKLAVCPLQSKEYAGKDFEMPDEETIEKLKEIFTPYGIECDVGR